MAAKETSTDSSPVDFETHAKDYSLMIAMLKWGAVIAVLTGFAVMIILAN